eukprot:g15784.t1
MARQIPGGTGPAVMPVLRVSRAPRLRDALRRPQPHELIQLHEETHQAPPTPERSQTGTGKEHLHSLHHRRRIGGIRHQTPEVVKGRLCRRRSTAEMLAHTFKVFHVQLCLHHLQPLQAWSKAQRRAKSKATVAAAKSREAKGICADLRRSWIHWTPLWTFGL